MSELLPTDPELNRMPIDKHLARQPDTIIRTFASHEMDLRAWAIDWRR
ncbi:hypothetical protein [Sinorhizobium fredii]|nr:hypothetical protein [Sinorhizobium fredii]